MNVGKTLQCIKTRSSLTTVVVGAAQRLHIWHLICVRSFGALTKAVRFFTASLHNLPMYHKMCSIEFFPNLKPVGWNLKSVLFGHGLGIMGVDDEPIWIPRPWVHISFPWTHMVCLLLLLVIYLTAKAFSFRPSNPDLMTNISLKLSLCPVAIKIVVFH